MLTRRSSRHRHAASANSVNVDAAPSEAIDSTAVTPETVVDTATTVVAATAVAAAAVAAAPMSRRAARERQRAHQPDSRVEQGEAQHSDAAESDAGASTRPVTAAEMRRRRSGKPAVDEPVSAILAETLVVTSSPQEVAELPAEEAEAPLDPTVLLVASETAEPTEGDSSQRPVQDEDTADADAFLAASRAFQATPRQAPSEAASEQAADPQSDEAPEEHVASDTAHIAPRRGRGSAARKTITFGATVGVMGVAGLLAISTTLPAEAIAAAQGAQVASATSLVAASSPEAATEASDEEIQAFVASSALQNEAIQRTEDFSTMSLVDVAAEQGIRYSSDLYTNDPNAAIQWPFMVGVAMSSGYGPRNGRLHAGIDLVPGAGAPIQAIADGTVRIATESGGAYGVTVYIDHVIDGQVVTSHYAHMQYGSLQVAAGDTVKVGDTVGLVGNTGRSYGAHLHFEIIINGSTIDPLPWMQENAGRYEY